MDTLLIDDGSQTVTNKTIDGDNNTISNLDLGNEVDWAAIGDVTDAGAFETGDKVLVFEAGVGMRKVDYTDLPGAGGGASQLSDLSDVNTSTATNKNVLVADGVDWESRALVEADISDLGNYIESGSAEHDNFSDFVANEHIDHSTVSITAGTGLTGGGTIASNRTLNVDVGIADDKIVQMDDTDAAENDYCKLTANGIVGRSYSEVRSDLNVEDGADVTDTTNVVSSLSGATLTGALVAADHGTASTDQVVNVCYGTSETPPTASNTTEGCIYVQYTA